MGYRPRIARSLGLAARKSTFLDRRVFYPALGRVLDVYAVAFVRRLVDGVCHAVPTHNKPLQTDESSRAWSTTPTTYWFPSEGECGRLLPSGDGRRTLEVNPNADSPLSGYSVRRRRMRFLLHRTALIGQLYRERLVAVSADHEHATVDLGAVGE